MDDKKASMDDGIAAMDAKFADVCHPWL